MCMCMCMCETDRERKKRKEFTTLSWERHGGGKLHADGEVVVFKLVNCWLFWRRWQWCLVTCMFMWKSAHQGVCGKSWSEGVTLSSLYT